ncbi:MAG: hypothetical protein JW829_13090, partial [Pirellulales bacterium]|nr:hypothetical protein [Pirellulales bacterium]
MKTFQFNVLLTGMLLLSLGFLGATAPFCQAQGEESAAPAPVIEEPAVENSQASQDPGTPDSPTTKTATEKTSSPTLPTDTPVPDTDSSAPEASPPAQDTETSTPDAETPPAGTSPPTSDAGGSGSGPATQAPTSTRREIPWTIFGIVVALFVVPILIGRYLARVLRMPDYAWKIALVLGTIAAAVVMLIFGELKYGVDLAGGVTLIYELEEPKAREDLSEEETQSSQKELMGKMIDQIIRRVNPGGQLEITVREYGIGQIEIIIPEAGQEDLERIKRAITTLGELEFRITADHAQEDDQKIIAKAMELSPYDKRVLLDGKEVGKWIEYNKERFESEGGTPLVTRVGKDRSDQDIPEALVLLDKYNVVGQYLDQTWAGNDPETGNPAVHFTFNSTGAKFFGGLTGANRPKQGGG